MNTIEYRPADGRRMLEQVAARPWQWRFIVGQEFQTEAEGAA